jgi:hypothetical protein
VPDFALRPIDIEDWGAVHEWASAIEACRYEAWGPNAVAETKAFVAQAVSEWQMAGGTPMSSPSLLRNGTNFTLRGTPRDPPSEHNRGCNTSCERTACRGR